VSRKRLRREDILRGCFFALQRANPNEIWVFDLIWVAVEGQEVVPVHLDVLMRSGLWKSWKAEVRFPLSHNPGCCYEYGIVGVA
jgi:hypothetical protein